jgi:hypothetical protein
MGLSQTPLPTKYPECESEDFETDFNKRPLFTINLSEDPKVANACLKSQKLEGMIYKETLPIGKFFIQ